MGAKGTYILMLYVNKETVLQIGKLGSFTFMRGTYAYAGSAFGPGGLAARLKHHRSISTRPHWHIDYLRRAASLGDIWVSAKPERLEHVWAEQLLTFESGQCPVKGFGSSDCACYSHLVYFKRKPSPAIISRVLTGAVKANNRLRLFKNPPNTR